MNRLKKQKRLIEATCVFTVAVAACLNAPGVSAAFLSASATMYGDLAVISATSHSWQFSGDDMTTPRYETVVSDNNTTSLRKKSGLKPGQEILGGTAGDVFVSGKGNAGYKSTQTLDATDINEYTSDTSLKFSDGGVYEDSIHENGDGNYQPPSSCDSAQIVDQHTIPGMTPYSDSITQNIIGLGSQGEYQGSKTVSQAGEEADSVSFDGKATGKGFATSYLFANSQSGTDTTTSALMYEEESYQHRFAAGNQTGYGLSLDLEWSSFRTAFGEVEQNSTEEAAS